MERAWLEQEVTEITEELIRLRRDFHAHPELGKQEERTAQVVESYLRDLGLTTTRMFGTGVVACLEGGKPGKCLLLRADMDALPIQEENDVPYCSQNPGVMHACGHDGHTAMLLAAAKILVRHREELAGTVKFVFQPNEEEAGAGAMVAEGALENPHVDASFGMHLWSQLGTGLVGLSAGPVMAEMYNFKITVEGKAAHSSTPNEGVDAILCATDIIQTAQMIQTREIDPMYPTCLAFGTIHGGTKSNIIAEHAEIEGCLRYLYDGNDEGEQCPRKRLTRIVESVAQAHRAKAQIEYEVSNYVLSNDEDMVQFVRGHVAPALVPEDKVVPYVLMAGEDFSEFSNHNNVPGCFMFLGVGDPEKGTDQPHHTVNFDIDEDMLPLGVKAHVQMAMEFLS